jgi:hypothetical protein
VAFNVNEQRFLSGRTHCPVFVEHPVSHDGALESANLERWMVQTTARAVLDVAYYKAF